MKKTLLGFLFIIMALSLVLSENSMLFGVNIFNVIITLILIYIMFDGLVNKRYFSFFIPLAIIFIMYKEFLNQKDTSNWSIICAAILISIGFTIIFSSNKKKCCTNHHNNYSKEPLEGEHIDYRTSLNSSTRFIKSNNLQTAHFECELGSLSIYLDNVTLNSNGAVLDLYNRLGEMKLYIPMEYNLVNSVNLVLADINDYHNNPSSFEISNTITLKGSVSLGEIKIIRT